MAQPCTCRVVSLLRVSTTMVEQSESPEAQRLYIQEQIKRNQTEHEVWVDTGLVYQDELTGAIVMNRPDIKRLIADALAGRFDTVLMKSIKRLGRDTLGLLTLKRFFDDHSIELIGLQDGYRSFRDMELIFLIHADRAQAEREDLSKNVRNAMRQRAKQGRWTCGKVPFGYRRKNRHELEPHPETAPIACKIFALRRDGWSLDAITRYLNQSLVPSPLAWESRDRLPKLAELRTVDERYAKKYERARRLTESGKAWHVKTVGCILQNTAYYGELQYYRRYYKNLSSQGGKKVLRHRDQSETIVIPCPPLLTKEAWTNSQVKLKVLGKATARYIYLLSGYLYCGYCGGKMSGGGTGHKPNRPYYGYYYCIEMRKGRCSSKSVRSQRLEDAVLTQLTDHLARIETLAEPPTMNVEPARVRVTHLQAKLDDLQDERRYYRNEHRRNRLTDDELDRELDRLSAEEETTQRLLDEAQQELGMPELMSGRAESTTVVAGQIIAMLNTSHEPGRGDDGRRWLKSLLLLAVEKVVFRGEDDFDIYLQFARPATE